MSAMAVGAVLKSALITLSRMTLLSQLLPCLSLGYMSAYLHERAMESGSERGPAYGSNVTNLAARLRSGKSPQSGALEVHQQPSQA
jgi:hypothetical protein